MDNIKIAVCFAGQYRTFDDDVVQKTLKYYLIDKYECDFYFSTWDNRGVSIHGGESVKKDDIITEYNIKSYLNECTIDIENFLEWESKLDILYKSLMINSGLHYGCIPQLYKKARVVSMIPTNKSYDFVIVTRPDNFIFGEFELNKLINTPSRIWNGNPMGKWPYYPNRIYDVMYMGDSNSIKLLSNAYNHISELLDDPYKSNLGRLDCCKMLYIYAKKYCNLDVRSTNSLITDVYRGGNSVEYYLKNTNRDVNEFKLRFNL
jgi:hypothetical protein